MKNEPSSIATASLTRVVGGIKPWSDSMSDGCTLSPDGTWRQACVDHDKAYYYGGTAAQRRAADGKLAADMVKQGAPAWVAKLYQGGVRIGGAPGTGAPWRWGFGHK